MADDPPEGTRTRRRTSRRENAMRTTPAYNDTEPGCTCRDVPAGWWEPCTSRNACIRSHEWDRLDTCMTPRNDMMFIPVRVPSPTYVQALHRESDDVDQYADTHMLASNDQMVPDNHTLPRCAYTHMSASNDQMVPDNHILPRTSNEDGVGWCVADCFTDEDAYEQSLSPWCVAECFTDEDAYEQSLSQCTNENRVARP